MDEGLTDARWADALTAAALLAVDPAGLGGALLRARAGPARTLWLAALRHGLPAGTPWRRMPQGIADDRLLGGLDLAATLQAGRPVAQRGLLAEGHGGVLVLAMAERLAAGTVARIAATLDTGAVRMERDGLALQQPARIGLVALDEGADDDEAASPVLADRLAFHLLLDDLPGHGPGPRPAGLGSGEPDAAQLDALLAVSATDVADARTRLAQVASGDGTAEALCRAAVALGIPSLRAPWLALRAAIAAAALQGHDTVEPDDAALAARLVLGPRATRLPMPPEAQPPADESPLEPAEPPADAPPPDNAAAPPPPPPEDDPAEADAPPPDPAQPLDEVVLEAALAAMPAGLLAQLKAGGLRRSAAPSAGRAGALQAGGARGRPLGARRGELRAGARLDLIATLRAAAPWQRLRQREATEAAAAGASPRRVVVRPEDFHISRRAQRRETTTVFVVDASGSAALHRLAEAKGAVELLLADCYVRRDKVALLAFRGSSVELMLPPTRSLVRAKRALAGLPGGGGTPLAQALDAAADLAEHLLKRGGTPVLVLLSDARANIARDGQPGRAQATADALASARRLRALGLGMLMVDTAPGAGRAGSSVSAGRAASGAGDGPPPARSLATALGALYLPLPQVDAQRLSQAARALAGPAR